MNRFWIALLVSVAWVLLLTLWGRDQAPPQRPTSAVDATTNTDLGPSERTTPASVRPTVADKATPATNFVNQTTTGGATPKIDREKPPQVVALDLTVRELKLELALKETTDLAQRAAIQGEIASIRVCRQALCRCSRPTLDCNAQFPARLLRPLKRCSPADS